MAIWSFLFLPVTRFETLFVKSTKINEKEDHDDANGRACQFFANGDLNARDGGRLSRGDIPLFYLQLF